MTNAYMSSHCLQMIVQRVLVCLALLDVPVLLLGRPLFLYFRHRNNRRTVGILVCCCIFDKIMNISGFPRAVEFLEYHGILKGQFQTLKVREFYICFCPSHGQIKGIFVLQLHSVVYLRAVFCVNSVYRYPRLWHAQALNWVSLSVFLAPEQCVVPISDPLPQIKSLSDCLILTPPPHLTLNLPILGR